MTLLEKNKLIVDVLLRKYGWHLHSEGYVELEGYEFINDFADGLAFWNLGNLKFHSDSNWQWLCVKRIAEIEGISVLRAYWLLDSFYPFVYPAMELEDIFEAIFNYTKHRKDFINSLQ